MSASSTPTLATSQPQVPTSTSSPQQRLLSVDVLRGFDMLWITGLKYFVLASLVTFGFAENYQATKTTPYINQLHHVAWEGLRFYDLVFPLFLFLTGITIPLSITAKLKSGRATKRDLTIRCIRRLLLLIVLGMIHQIHGLPDRWCSVLGFIGLSYFIAAMFAIYTPRIIQFTYIPISLILYYLAIRFIPFNGHPAGTMLWDANLPSYLDSYIIPQKHFLTPESYFEPEGPTMAISGAALAMLGVFAGYILTSVKTSPHKRALQLLLASLGCLLASFIWSFDLPLIKQIWSPSFILAAAGYAFLMTALFYYVIDIINNPIINKLCFPLQLYGQNALAVYMIGPAIGIGALTASVFSPLLDNIPSTYYSMTHNALILLTQLAYLYYFHKKRIFLRV